MKRVSCRYCGSEYSLLVATPVCLSCASLGKAGDDCMWRARRMLERSRNPGAFYLNAFRDAFAALIRAHAHAIREGRLTRANKLARKIHHVDTLIEGYAVWTQEHLIGVA